MLDQVCFLERKAIFGLIMALMTQDVNAGEMAPGLGLRG